MSTVATRDNVIINARGETTILLLYYIIADADDAAPTPSSYLSHGIYAATALIHITICSSYVHNNNNIISYIPNFSTGAADRCESGRGSEIRDRDRFAPET